MIKSPAVTSLTIDKLSANQVQISWDNVGSNFYYFVELAEVSNRAGRSGPARPDLSWINLGYTAENVWFESNAIRPDTFYQMRVRSATKGMDQSKWVYTEVFQTFTKNVYTLEHMREFQVSQGFIDHKLGSNQMGYIDFNADRLQATLMKQSFQFVPKTMDVITGSIEQEMLREGNYHEIQDHIEAVCNDIDRTMLAEIDGILYLFERYQPVVKASNDKGQNWQYYKALNGRVGNPVSRTCVYQSDTTTYVLGYDTIFYGRRASDYRWSSDEIRFSRTDVTFAKMGDELGLGFDVELFGEYAALPAVPFTRHAEAMACTNEYLFVVARDRVIRLNLINPYLNPADGKRAFDPWEGKITNNPKAVCKKLDTIDGRVLALITGEVKQLNMDPTIKGNVIDSESKGVYLMREDMSGWDRVFGNTKEERRYIEHEFTNMSVNWKKEGTRTDGEVFINFVNWKYDELIPDTKLPTEFPDSVAQAVAYATPPAYLSDKKRYMSTWRAHFNDLTKWRIRPQEYYNEANYTWMRRSGVRCWITNDNRPLVVYPSIVYTKDLDVLSTTDPDRVLHEYWDKGTGIFKMKNISFDGFNQYAAGVLIHKDDGKIFGYFEFDYRVRDQAQIIWKPLQQALKVSLMNQTREEEWKPEVENGLRDPDLRPLLDRTMPDSYLLNDDNFKAFSEYYLQFLSDGNNTYYNKLLNLIRNKYPREKDSYEWLWSEVNKRNIYLDKAKREAVVKFFVARQADFYQTKGIEDSYKFLFKLLYNEEVEIDVESKAGLEYDITVQSDNMSDEYVGTTVYTPTGRANITYIDREYRNGKLEWVVTIHNLLGRFEEGQILKDEKGKGLSAMIIRGVRGKELMSNNIDYINRSRSYYVMKIRSRLPTSRYVNDVIRFVHPVGFGFIGITLLTMLINAGLNMKHTETIINKLKNYRWDAGLPSVYPDRVLKFTVDGSIERDPNTGEVLYGPYPNAGAPFPLPADYDANEKRPKDPQLWNMLPSQRRRPLSPTFDQSAVTFAKFRDLVNQRLKDDIGNPRDVTKAQKADPNWKPSQIKIPKEKAKVNTDE